MIRAASRSLTCRPSILVGQRRIQFVRHQSGSSGGGGAGKAFVASFVTIAGLAGGTIGYAGYDTEFRLLVEDSVPGSKDVFDLILGDGNVDPQPLPKKVDISVPPSKLKEFRLLVEDSVPGSKEVFDVILGDDNVDPGKPLPKKIDISVPPSKLKIDLSALPPMPVIEKPPETEIKAEEKVAEATPEIQTPEVIAPEPTEVTPEIITPEVVVPEVVAKVESETKIIEEPTSDIVKEEEPSKNHVEEDTATIVSEEVPKEEIPAEVAKEEVPTEEDIAKNEVAELEAKIEEACKLMEAKVKKVKESSQGSIDATKHHMALIQGVLDESETRDQKRAWNDVFEAANKKSELLKDTDKALSDALKFVKDSVVADEHKAASLAELEKVVSALDAVKKEAKLIDDYRNLVEEGRQQFQKEIEAILPGTNLSDTNQLRLSEEELNIFMTHAYRKVCQLQDELAKAQTFSQRLSLDLRESETTLSGIDIQSELDAQRRELEVDQHRKLVAMKEEMEKEIRTQMKRQITAHADHINDLLEVQGKELGRMHERDLDEKLNNETASHKNELANLKGWLEGLEKSIEQKDSMAQTVFDSQEFWLACMSLQKTVESGADKATVENSVKAVKETVQKSAAFREDALVQTLLNSIPNSDVPASSEIKGRFNRVEEMARRTALVGDEDVSSLLLYVLSYLQSLLIISPASTVAVPDKSDDVIDVAALNTFDIVWLAKKAMEVDDLEQAVKYMNLLNGEPRRQASDWLANARLHLELQQSCEALASYAHAIGAEAVPVVAAASEK